MNKKLFTIIAIAVSAFSFTATAGNTAFNHALKKVDQGGEILTVYSASEYYKKFIDSMAAITAANNQQLQNQMIYRGQKALGMDKIKAQAFSSKEVVPGCWISKNYVYCGEKAMALPNVYNTIAGGADRQLDILSLPADTIYAASFDVDAAAIYKMLRTEFTSRDDQAKQIFTSLPLMTQRYGIDLDKFVASISGNYKILIAASDIENLLINIEIPDKHGVLAGAIRKNLRLPPTATETTLPLFFMPVKTSFMPGKIRFTNEVKRNNIGTLAQTPAFANYVSRIGSKGAAYMVINVTPQHISLMRAAIPPQINKMLQLKPFSALMLTKQDPAGGYFVSAANFSVTSAISNAGSTILMGMILPALQNAREKARLVSCMHNLKQIAIALSMYANDNNDRYPQANGIAGLQQLIDKKYLNPAVFTCQGQSVKPSYPGNKLTADCPYIYIGGITKELSKTNNLYLFPIAFSKPGIHKDQVNVLFADGHVQRFQVPAYNTPTQVIGVLNKHYKYNPQLLDQILRAVAEN